uniref:C-type lectin domain-containing protein n=1 Tax=Scleropages formosus TaxID=113540 RepID=A0A8C9S678_SCLFO
MFQETKVHCHGFHCASLPAQKETWSDAQSYCRNNHTDLVSVKDQTENDYIYTTILQPKNLRTNTVWLGLFRETWKWSDQRNSSFRYWARGQPDNYYRNENCAVTSFRNPGKGKWDDVQCDLILPFLCYNSKLLILCFHGQNTK